MEYKFPKLYLETSDGKIRIWEIWVEGKKDNSQAEIYTRFGFIDGKILVSSPDIIRPTQQEKSPYSRALKLATTRWKNRVRKGYHPEKPKQIRRATGITKIVKTPVKILPMRPYNLREDYVIYPAYVQPKIDGYRVLIHKEDDHYSILSSTGREYEHLRILDKDLDKIREIEDENFYLDGEVVIENQPINIVRSVLSTIELNQKQYQLLKQTKCYIFDCFDLNRMELDYEKRFAILKKIFKHKFTHLKLIPCSVVHNKDEMDKLFEYYVEEGYEGIIIRNKRGIYKLRGRSIDILKSKSIKKDKFTIIGYKEGQKGNAGTVIWKIQCKNNKNAYFWAKPMGTREYRKSLFKSGDKYIGRQVNVKFFHIDADGCVTKNPVAYF